MDVLVIFTDNRTFLLQAVAPKKAPGTRADENFLPSISICSIRRKMSFYILDTLKPENCHYNIYKTITHWFSAVWKKLILCIFVENDYNCRK